MEIALIAAVADNNIIGNNNSLLWRLPKDLKFFKETTTGHHILMGRKTFESIGGGKPLPNRTSIIITRQKDYKAEGCKVVHSIEEALEYSKGQEKIFIIGGGEIYSLALDIANTLYITHVKTTIEGDTVFPSVKWDEWEKEIISSHNADEKHAYNFDIVAYRKTYRS